MSRHEVAERDLRDVAHLAHVQLLTPVPDDSAAYFTRMLGMVPVHAEGGSVFLRGVWDYEQYCLQLTEAPQPGIGRVALRARSEAALHRRAAALAEAGLGKGWTGGFGHGPAYAFTDPDGHPFEIYYETTRYQPPPDLAAPMKNQPQRHRGVGAGVRRLEHVNLLARDVGRCRLALERSLGLQTNEIVMHDDAEEAGAWMSSTIQGHEVIYTRDALRASGRLHHVAFWLDSRDEVLRVADLYQDQGVTIEAGPSRHTAVQSFYLYCYEPGGNRIEVTTGGYLVFDPDAPPVVWSADEWAGRAGWGHPLPVTFHTYGTPSADAQATDAATTREDSG